ncbi:MAG: FeoA domain-containing protein [Oscillospiraceae bacterium]|jgi:ferrous iron transport protein A|nr:FeoA domain-containing protein [Oscillospiraceae bacterium]
MTLYEGKVGRTYSVASINLSTPVRRRLEILGMTEHASVSLINKSLSGAIVIKIRGTRFALGKAFAKGILIEGGAAT